MWEIRSTHTHTYWKGLQNLLIGETPLLSFQNFLKTLSKHARGKIKKLGEKFACENASSEKK